jgi:cullin 1
LRLIECHRNGETIDQGLLKKVLDYFVSLGIDEIDLDKISLDNYKEHFEIPFLVATEAYYKNESDSLFVENSVSDYVKMVEERLEEEEDRAERCLHTTTRKPLVVKFIRAHAESMLEIFQSLLDDDKDEDLPRMYSLVSRNTQRGPDWRPFLI